MDILTAEKLFHSLMHILKSEGQKRSFHMKNRKWLSLAAAMVLIATALPMSVFAETKDSTEEKKLTEVTLNEVAHSIFYAPQYVAIEERYFQKEGLDLILVTGFGTDKTMTALIS